MVRLYDAVEGKVSDPPIITIGKSEGRTDGDGTVILVPKLIYTERNKAFRQSGWIQFYHTTLLITAEGFDPLYMHLEEYTGSRTPVFDPPLPPLTIGMTLNQLGEKRRLKPLPPPIIKNLGLSFQPQQWQRSSPIRSIQKHRVE